MGANQLALVGILFIGCEAAPPPQLGSLPAGDPAVLEPGYVPLPSLRMSGSPAIEILSSGGMAGGGAGNVRIWDDGTVLFYGAVCPTGSSRRGKLSPARVHAVIDTLEAAHFFTWSRNKDRTCRDAITTSLTVQRGGASNTVIDTGCPLPKPSLARQAIGLVMQVVGENACSPDAASPR